MMPQVEVEEGRGLLRKKRFISLLEEWQEMQNLLGGDRTPQKEAHKKDLFGSTSIQNTNMFVDVQLGSVEGIPPFHEFKKLDIHNKAMYIAYARISSMTKIINRHHDILDRNYKKMLSNTKKNKKT